MSYSEFTIRTACRRFDLVLDDESDLHSGVSNVGASALLHATLADSYQLATSIRTEKALSELVIAPILLEVRRRTGRRVSFFSGVEFEVDPPRGLNGAIGFLFSGSNIQLDIMAPVLAVVEAKSDSIKDGLGQCVAEMVAARIYNEREGLRPTTIHGAVTTGSHWRFVRLEGSNLSVDVVEYPFVPLEKILGILVHCVGGWSS